MPYSKVDMISTLAKAGGVAKDKAAAMLDALTVDLARALAAGEAVDLFRFGRFTTYAKGERKGRNLQTGEPMTISARTAVKFAPAPHLKALLNPGREGSVATGAEKPSPGANPAASADPGKEAAEGPSGSPLIRRVKPEKKVTPPRAMPKALPKGAPVK